MRLCQAFDLSRGDVAAFVGAGGKTSLLVGLGYELAESGWRVLATATTEIPAEQLSLYPHAMRYDSGAEAISQALSEYNFVFLYDMSTWQKGVLSGPREDWARELLDSVDSDVLLVEADRSDGLPFKAPFENEPWIPPETSLVVPIASLTALGAPLDDEHIYNPAAMMEQYGFLQNSPVKSPWLAQVLRDEELGLKNVPEGARVTLFLNRTPERGYLRGRARAIARLSLQNPRVQAVAIGSVRGAEPVHEVQRAVGAIVLASGDSDGKALPSMLLSAESGKTILAHVTEQLIRSRIAPIRVAAGRWAREVRAAVKPLGVKVVTSRARTSATRPNNWGEGSFDRGLGLPHLFHLNGEALSTLKAGLRAMPAHIAAVLVVPGDHPRLQPKVIYQLLTSYARGAEDLLVPSYQASLGQPVLIGRRYWSDILSLSRKASLHDLFEEYRDNIAHVEVGSDTILFSNKPRSAVAE
ncbi:MAG: selenium cofactor biosynthesis protein YqeC [Chloroflexota bacterium]|nr:selenium cofactor biosynthesis protein YqeC [Chloroflexota bacterium]MDE2858559.1 selenium cofactor biosynthesis protein YqeC [Chloroflexota bacterium]